ncbi:D-2-hydroxyacid dehydrogenase, partial [Thioclava sp. BHET1]
IGLMLSLTRQLAAARDNQRKAFWRPEQPDPALREDEVAGKTLLILGTGGIGNRIARIAKALDMTVIGIRRDATKGRGDADEIHGFEALMTQLPRADVLILSCPLTEETRNIIDAAALAQLRPSALLVNVARGGCIDAVSYTHL